MIIDQLPNLGSVQETDEIPVERGTTTYKTTLQKVRDLLQTLLTFPVTSVNGMTGAVDVYPVGSIYMSVNSTDPGTLFGGTWEQLEDRFLLAAGTTYTAGDTGGEATHTLTVDEMPSHYHALTYRSGASTGSYYGQPPFSSNSGTASGNATGSTGGGAAHNNMPPYLAVYMWKRTA